ncbi:hypothetical protein JHS3_12160 [Jeongeupia sp. HS-3]|uniref:NUDIX hydrolase n=1 Tax=Jeongeupia sp. HS-3 TaxID=1009682 RepID=UPI0018A3AA7C|nr:DUF4743 domain-containing protein [Jeongeupia sp. HS-3]BCL75480.1 hypothetical protein JHS3_12160 [Jeongeupia sp. HS-3]
MDQRLDEYLARQPRFDASGLTRLHVLDEPVGWLEPQIGRFLQAFSPSFVHNGPQLVVTSSIEEVESLFGRAALAMRAAGLIHGWRNEPYTCFALDASGAPDLNRPLFKLERGAFRRFGLTSRAVHVNGYAADRRLWTGRRSPNKAIDPNRLDNLAAGGIAAGEVPDVCVIRELWEEAGVPVELARRVCASTTSRSTRNEPDGIHDEVLYNYDLLLPGDFTPRNTDGEVAGFTLMDVDTVLGRLGEFTDDAGLVTATFLRRQGWA